MPPDLRFVRCAAEPVEWEPIQAADGGSGLRKFGMTAYTGAAMNLGWGVPVVLDLAGLTIPRQDLPVLRQHDPERMVGHSTAVEKSAQRLKVAGVISGTGDEADQVKATAANGFPWQSSVGAAVERSERVDAGQKVTVNGRTFTGPLYVVRQSTLREVSFVTIGADGATSAAVAASLGGSPVDFDSFVKAAGFDPAALTDAQRTFLTAQHAASLRTNPPPNPNPGTPGDSLEAAAAAARAENDRRQAITAAAAKLMKQDPSMTDALERAARLAIDGGLTVQAAELELMKLSYGRGPSVAVRTAQPVTGDALTAALCRSAGHAGVDKQFEPRALEAADRHFKGGVGLQEAIDLVARAKGYTGRGVKRDHVGALRAALAPADRIEAAMGPSTMSLPGILGNFANKSAAAAFDAVDQSWREIAAIGRVDDFKQRTAYGLTGDMVIEPLAPGGEIKHATAGEVAYTNQAVNNAKMFVLPMEAVINDDLGVFDGLGKKMGRGGALGFNKTFWTKFLNNSSFFTSGRGNAASGAGTALSVDSLTQADALFASQTDPDGQPLAVTPKILLVPPALRVPALRLMGSQGLVLVGTSGSVVERGDMNPFAGSLKVVSSPYLSNPSYTGYSATAWYELADPNDVPVIEAVFLNGQERPQVETSEAEFNVWGLAWRVLWAFGVEFQEYRGGVRMAGV